MGFNEQKKSWYQERVAVASITAINLNTHSLLNPTIVFLFNALYKTYQQFAIYFPTNTKNLNLNI